MLDNSCEVKRAIGIAVVVTVAAWRFFRKGRPSDTFSRNEARQVTLPMEKEDEDKIILWAPPAGPQTTFVHNSPFVTKLEFALRLSGLDYRWVDRSKFCGQTAPKGKFPCIVYNGTLHEDSRFIIDWLAQNKGFDLDRGLSPEQKATSHACVRMLEESLVWANMLYRWTSDEGFKFLCDNFFKRLPWYIRLFVPRAMRKRMKRLIYGQGTGRLSDKELIIMVRKDFAALETILTNAVQTKGSPCKTIFGTASPTLLDVVAFAQLGAINFVPQINSPLRQELLKHPILISYLEDMYEHYFPKKMSKYKAAIGGHSID